MTAPPVRHPWRNRRARVVLIIAAAVSAVVAVGLAVVAVASPGSGRTHGASPSTGATAAASAPTTPAEAAMTSAASPSTGPSGTAAPDDPGAGAQRLEACVKAAVDRLSLDQRVGQLLMVGTPVANPEALGDVVARYGLGGVFLAGRSSQSAAALRHDIELLQRRALDTSGVALHIAVDQEGGQVQTLQGADFPVIPTAVEQGRWAEGLLRERTNEWANRLVTAGITMDLAPVADTVPAGTADQNPPIGAYDRQFGSVPDDVARHVATVVSAAQSAGVVTTLKHFPGLGRVRANTDTSDAAVDTVTSVDDPYLKPFVSGMAAGSRAVMISSASYPRLDPDNVAAFSYAVVTGLLRKRLGYSGLVVSDDLGAAKAVAAVPLGTRAVRFIAAGGDIVLTVRPTDAGPMAAALVAAARSSPAFADRVTEAATRVLHSKASAGLAPCGGGSARR